MAKKKRAYDMTMMIRLADFVRGRTGIPRAQLRAAFPTASTSVVSLLTALGHVEPGKTPAFTLSSSAREKAMAKSLATRRAKKIGRLERELAEARAKAGES